MDVILSNVLQDNLDGIGATCTTCTNNCVQFSSLSARVGVFGTLHQTSAWSNYSNASLATNCAGETTLYSVVAGSIGYFSTIIFTDNISNYSVVPDVNSSNSDGFYHKYVYFVAQDGYFSQTVVTPSVSTISSICYLDDSCRVGPTGPRGIRGVTGPVGDIGPTGPSVWTQTAQQSTFYTAGPVGVGTNSPAYTLDVSGSAYATNYVQVNDLVNLSSATAGGTINYYNLIQKTGIVSVDCRASSITNPNNQLILTLPVGIKGGTLNIVNVTDENNAERYPFAISTTTGTTFTHLGPTSSITLSYISTLSQNKWYRLN